MSIENQNSTQAAVPLFGTTGRDNQPRNTTAILTSDEDETLEEARVALVGLKKKTFENWKSIGHGVKILRKRANLFKGRKTFAILMAEQGFRIDGQKAERQFDKATVTRLLQIMDNLPDVEAWREKLEPHRQHEWSSPNSIFKHCPVFTKPIPDHQGEKPLTRLQQTEQALAVALERIAKLEDGDTWNPKTSTARDIAVAMVGQLQPYKGKSEKVIKEMRALLDQHKAVRDAQA